MRAREKYHQGLDYLATPPVAERADGYKSLWAERINLLLPMAETYARLGMKEQALTALEQMQTMIWAPGMASLMENKMLVRHVGNAALAARIRVGDEIVAIDGQAVKHYAEQRVAPFVGVGVLPDIEAHPTVASVRSGADPVLERALTELGKR